MWALKDGVVFQWNAELGLYEERYIGAETLTVAKQDDVAFIIDENGDLRQWDYDVEDWNVFTDIGAEDLETLRAVNKDKLWANDSSGTLYQWSPVAINDPSVPPFFVEQSSQIGAGSVDVATFAIDDKEILYAIDENNQSALFNVAPENLPANVGERIQYTDTAVDNNGNLHLVYQNDAAIVHAVNADGVWQNKLELPGTTGGEDINVATDAEGNVYVAWIEGTGNNAEIYLAKGIPNAEFGGYAFSDPYQVTEDDVVDDQLKLVVTPQGGINLSAIKQPDQKPQEDADIYTHFVDGDAGVFTFSNQQRREPIVDEDPIFLEIDELDSFLVNDELYGPEGYGLTLGVLSTIGWAKKFLGDTVKLKGFIRATSEGGQLSPDQTNDVRDSQYLRVRIEGNADANLKKILKFLPFDAGLGVLGKVDAFGRLHGDGPDGFLIGRVGLKAEAFADLLHFIPFLRAFQEGAAFLGTELKAGIRVEWTTRWLWELFQIEEEGYPVGGEDGQVGATFLPVRFIDSRTGLPLAGDGSTPEQDVIAEVNLNETIALLLSTILPPPLFGDSVLDDGVDFIGMTNRLEVGLQFTLGTKLPPYEFKFYSSVLYDFQSKIADTFENVVMWRTRIEQQIGPVFMRLLDTTSAFKVKDGETNSATTLGLADYVVGGTSTLEDNGTALLGDEVFTNIVDDSDFDFIVVGDQAYGVYVEEILSGGIAVNVVRTIDGYVDSDGQIVWQADTIQTIDGSDGINVTPLIATNGNEDLVITWGGVPSTNEDLKTVLETPPGKAYVVFGGSDKSGILDLGGLNDDPTVGDGYYLTADGKHLYSVGNSVAALGDINPTGGNGDAPDFIIGAPDAEAEAGVAYVIFGESYETATLDNLDGSNGFRVVGEADSELGFVVETAGNIRSDSTPAIVVAAPGADDQNGAVYIIDGDNDWASTGGEITADQIGDTISGLVLEGPETGGRFGTALATGADVTDDTIDDLLVASGTEGDYQFGLFDGAALRDADGTDPVAPAFSFVYDADTNEGAAGLNDSAALLPDINGDGIGDVVLGQGFGHASIVFGGDRMETYGENYVAKWTADALDDSGDIYQVIISFDGVDLNGDGYLSGRGSSVNDGVPNEITAWRYEVYLTDGATGASSLEYSVGLADQLTEGFFLFNYDLETARIAAERPWVDVFEAPEADKAAIALEAFSIGAPSFFSPTNTYGLSVNSARAVIDLTSVSQAKFTKVAETLTGTQQVNKLFDSGLYDVQLLHELPNAGVQLEDLERPLPLQVSAAGDVNNDGIGDLIVGYGQSTDEDGNPIIGGSYIVYGGTSLTSVGSLDLSDLDPSEGVALVGPNGESAGGHVSAAGDVNGDGIDDVIVSEPAFSGDTNNANGEAGGVSYVFFGFDSTTSPNGAPTLGYTLDDSIDGERSGSSLAPIGDIDGDDATDLLIGAPNGIDFETYQAAVEASEINYATRDLNSTDPWGSAALLEGANGSVPAAIGNTSVGTLAAWVEVEEDGNGNPISYSLYGSFFDGTSWSDPEEIRTSDLPITGVNVLDRDPSDPVIITPAVTWIESDEDTSGPTTLYQNTYSIPNNVWSNTPDIIQAYDQEVPPAGAHNNDVYLDVQDSIVEIGDAVALESDGSVRVEVVRSGNLDQSIELTYRTRDVSATATRDYTHVEGTIVLGPGEASAMIEIELFADGFYELHGETFVVEVRASDPDAVFASNGVPQVDQDRLSATVWIGEDDATIDLTAIDSGFIVEDQTGIELGYAVNSAGDLNGDGYDDFLIGAIGSGEDNEGTAYLLYGKNNIAILEQNLDLATIDNQQGAILNGGIADGQAGYAFAHGVGMVGAAATLFIVVGAPGIPTDDSQGRVYILTDAAIKAASKTNPNEPNEIELDTSNSIVLPDQIGPVSLFGTQFGGDLMVASLNGTSSHNADDLVIVSENGDQITIVYDILSQGTTGPKTLADYTTTVITNGSGRGFGGGVAIGDFTGNGYNDLIVGSPGDNPAVDSFNAEDGAGGIVSVIKGIGGFAAEIDVANLGNDGFQLLGQADFVPTESQSQGNPIDGSPDEDLRNGTVLLDGVGDAIALADLNGDGIKDLVLGAPLADLTDGSDNYVLERSGNGRVYVLFGDSDRWEGQSEAYQLLSLYGENYQDGIILEGTETASGTGHSVANAGYFRGTTSLEDDIEDVIISAPLANASAGQAYVLFGSTNYYSGLSQGKNIFQLDPEGNPHDPDTALIFAFQGDADSLDIDNPINEGMLGFSVDGLGNITSKSISGTDGDDIALGAPNTNIDDLAKVYIATGAPYLQPGNGLNVKDLRSDNGFIVQTTGSPAAVGDFNGDGFTDFALETGSIVLGAPTLTEENFEREIPLGAPPVAYPEVQDRLEWSGFQQPFDPDSLPGYSVAIEFSGIDLNGDDFIISSEITSLEYTVYTPEGDIYLQQNLDEIFIADFKYNIINKQIELGTFPAGFFAINTTTPEGKDLLFTNFFSSSDLSLEILGGDFLSGTGTQTSGQAGLSTDIFRSENAQRGNGQIHGVDFNGDGIADIVEIETPVNPPLNNPADWAKLGLAPLTFGVNAFTYQGSADPTGSIADPDAAKIPLTTISGVTTGDLNGDGYTDLIVSGYTGFMIDEIAAAADNGFAILAYMGGPQSIDFNKPEILLEVDAAIGEFAPRALTTLDVDLDGKDELIAVNTNQPFGLPYTEGSTTDLLVYEYGNFAAPTIIDFAEITGLPANQILDVYAAEQGDLNGDGRPDLNFGIQVALGPGLTSAYSSNYIVYATGRADFTVGGSSAPTVTSIRYSPTDVFETSPNADPLSPQYAPRATAIDDFNGDGIDDYLITSNQASDNSYIIYGSPNLPTGGGVNSSLTLLPDGSIFNTVTGGIYDGGYRPIKGLNTASVAYAPMGVGDVNGDGLADIALVDETNGLTTVVFGEQPGAERQLGVNYIEGTDEADILIQNASLLSDAVRVVAAADNDFIQVIADETSIILAGQGDDFIGLSSADSGKIVAIDGGLGHDTLFFNPEVGGFNNLDLSIANIKGIEVIDLGASNRLSLDLYSVKTLSDETNTLIIKGENSIITAKDEPVGAGWQHVGEGAYDGDLYDIYQYERAGGQDTNIRIWTLQDGVRFNALDLGAPIPDQTVTEETLYEYTVPNATFVSPEDDITLSAALADGSDLPDWLNFDAETGTFAGTPGLDASGIYHVTVTATTDADETMEDTYRLQVFDADTIFGTEDPDKLRGDDQNNEIAGLGEDDEIRALDGDDLLDGGAGNDFMRGGRGSDILRGGLGEDIQKGGREGDHYVGSAPELIGDWIIGFKKEDRIVVEQFDAADIEIDQDRFGQAEIRFDTDGDGTFDAALSVGRLFASAPLRVDQVGPDTIITVPFDGVAITGTEKGDLVNGSETVNGQPLPTGEEDCIKGKGGQDTLAGLGGDDVLRGGNGRDTLIGGAGNDILIGGRGEDFLRGGAGNDAFVLNKIGAHDRIKTFAVGEDVIVLDSRVFTALQPGELPSKSFVRGKPRDGSDHLIYKAGKSKLLYDENGDAKGGRTLIATFENKPDLSAGDIIVI
ncbi:putative Ig domain-containing protein [Bauldia sp.]|uniref:putative Ig domain-containing protein n=1 Tax=Bauldia sp. TaxID=2575872 RepID=UPI003BACC666